MGVKQEIMAQIFSEAIALSNCANKMFKNIDLLGYNPDELLAIADQILKLQGYSFSPAAEVAFRESLTRQMSISRFISNYSVFNTLERIRLRHANRLLATRAKRLTKKDLMTIEAEDILASQLFQDGIPD